VCLQDKAGRTVSVLPCGHDFCSDCVRCVASVSLPPLPDLCFSGGAPQWGGLAASGARV
jgi:hypothetical protein